MNIFPIFKISIVSGDGIQDLKLFLNLTQKRKSDVNKNDVKLYIDSCFSVQGVGTVVGGHLLSGNIKVGDLINKYKKYENTDNNTIKIQFKNILDKLTYIENSIKDNIKRHIKFKFLVFIKIKIFY